ncbi:MAG: SMC-Scp complex subunit ScpB, partial [Verrucomicrobiales bacterium]
MKLSQVVESLLFGSPEPLSTKVLLKAIRDAVSDKEKSVQGDEDGESSAQDVDIPDFGVLSEDRIAEAIIELNDEYRDAGRSFALVEGVVGWKVYTCPEYGDWVRHLFPGKKPERLSVPALETLAIIAYRQPIAKADIEAVRGVAVDGVLQKLIDRGLVHIAGRAELPGRPLLYESTEVFLEHFGIRHLDELPNSSELRRAELPTAEDREAEGEPEAGRAIALEQQLALSAVGGGGEEQQ